LQAVVRRDDAGMTGSIREGEPDRELSARTAGRREHPGMGLLCWRASRRPARRGGAGSGSGRDDRGRSDRLGPRGTSSDRSLSNRGRASDAAAARQKRGQYRRMRRQAHASHRTRISRARSGLEIRSSAAATTFHTTNFTRPTLHGTPAAASRSSSRSASSPPPSLTSATSCAASRVPPARGSTREAPVACLARRRAESVRYLCATRCACHGRTPLQPLPARAQLGESSRGPGLVSRLQERRIASAKLMLEMLAETRR